MRKLPLTKVEEKLKEVYFQYFTDYLVFSEQYNTLNEKGLLDVFIKSEYPYYLYEQVKKIEDHNIYPTNQIANLLELLSIIESRMVQVLDEKQTASLSKLIDEMSAILFNTINYDQTEIYFSEYIKRYSSIDTNNKLMGISVKQLQLDIQKDFLYLDILMESGIEAIDQIGDDFYSFLQKLFIDFPEIKEYPYMLKNLKAILKYRNDEKAIEYLHFLNDNHNYRNDAGFCTETVEVLYCDTLIKYLVFSKDSANLIKEIDTHVFYTVPFHYCLVNWLEIYTRKNKISYQERNAFQNIISYMRENINEYASEYRKDFTELFNSWICFFNTCQNEDLYNEVYTKEIPRRELLTWMFAKEDKEKTMKIEVDLQVSLAYDLMKYFMINEDKVDELNLDLCEGGKYTLRAFDSLFYNYPGMFFDKTIHERGTKLLGKMDVDDKKTEKFKQKIKRNLIRIRKDN